jgi:hypothetical protein
MTSFGPGGKSVVLVVFACAVLACGLAIFRPHERIGQWAIEYSTKAVHVVKVVDLDPYQASVTLQNVSRRPVTSLGLYIGTAAKYHEPVALKPGATTTVVIPKLQTRWTRVVRDLSVAAVLFGDGPAAADGDPQDIEYMRFERLGEALESARCLATLSGLDPAHLDDRGIDAVMGSSEPQLRLPFETFPAAFPASPWKAKLQGAGAAAQAAFFTGLTLYWGTCQTSLRQLMQQPNNAPESAESSRAMYLSELLTKQRATANEYRRLCDVDMGVAD